MLTALERLSGIGFVLAGHWRCADERLRITITAHENERNILYAIVVAAEVMYIGKSTNKLRERMQGYCNPGQSQLTNVKNNKNMLGALRNGSEVSVYIFRDVGLLRYGEFVINLAAGLEDSLIRELRPPWNGASSQIEESNHESRT